MTTVPVTHQFLPEATARRVICGKSIAEWNYAVVYVCNKQRPFDLPTHMYFQFIGSGDYRLDEIVTLVDQWTHFRGVCYHTYKEGDHEFNRARAMAVTIVSTFRRNYLKKHGSPPNPLGLPLTLDPVLIKKRTGVIIKKYTELSSLQLKLDARSEVLPHTAPD